MTDLNIRLLESKDLPLLFQLRWEFQKGENPDQQESLEEFMTACKEQYNSSTAHQNFVHVGAFHEGNLIAMASLYKIPMMPRPHKIYDYFGYVTNVYVTPLFRGKGVGKDLFTFIKDWAHQEDLELLMAWPSKDSQGFYRSQGFHPENQPWIYSLRAY